VEERDQHENKGGLPELIDVTKCNTVGTAFRGDESMEMTSASFPCQFRREGRKEAALRELALESEAKQSSSSIIIIKKTQPFEMVAGATRVVEWGSFDGTLRQAQFGTWKRERKKRLKQKIDSRVSAGVCQESKLPCPVR
jgi:hypothetical protein